MSTGQSAVQTSTGGITTLGLLGVAFVTLKLTGTIAWSWLWVTAPFWGPLAIAATLLVLFCALLAGTFVVAWIGSKRRGQYGGVNQGTARRNSTRFQRPVTRGDKP